MGLKFKKVLALLLLSAFLSPISAGNVFGCSVCVDGDRGQTVNISEGKECGTDELICCPNDSHDVSALHQFGDAQQGSCIDCFTGVSTVFSKRAKRIPTTAAVATISRVFPLNAFTSIKLVAGNLAPQPLVKTSQTLLVHRTVVLLN
jgi:hypothetical protein